MATQEEKEISSYTLDSLYALPESELDAAFQQLSKLDLKDAKGDRKNILDDIIKKAGESVEAEARFIVLTKRLIPLSFKLCSDQRFFSESSRPTFLRDIIKGYIDKHDGKKLRDAASRLASDVVAKKAGAKEVADSITSLNFSEKTCAFITAINTAVDAYVSLENKNPPTKPKDSTNKIFGLVSGDMTTHVFLKYFSDAIEAPLRKAITSMDTSVMPYYAKVSGELGKNIAIYNVISDKLKDKNYPNGIDDAIKKPSIILPILKETGVGVASLLVLGVGIPSLVVSLAKSPAKVAEVLTTTVKGLPLGLVMGVGIFVLALAYFAFRYRQEINNPSTAKKTGVAPASLPDPGENRRISLPAEQDFRHPDSSSSPTPINSANTVTTTHPHQPPI